MLSIDKHMLLSSLLCTVATSSSCWLWGAHLEQPHAPVLVQEEVKAEQLEAVGKCEEGQLPTDRLQALTWWQHQGRPYI